MFHGFENPAFYGSRHQDEREISKNSSCVNSYCVIKKSFGVEISWNVTDTNQSTKKGRKWLLATGQVTN